MVMVEAVRKTLNGSDPSYFTFLSQVVVVEVDSDRGDKVVVVVVVVPTVAAIRSKVEISVASFSRGVNACDVVLGGARRGGFGGPSSSFDRPPARW